MHGIGEEGHPVLHLVEHLGEEDHGGCIMHLRFDVDATKLHVAALDFFGVALDGRDGCESPRYVSAEQVYGGSGYEALHIKL